MSTQNQSTTYRERLSPSLWTLGATTMLAPMITLVLVPVDPVLGLTVGIAITVAAIALLIAGAPVVSVSGTVLRAGRARIPAHLLGASTVLTGAEARSARGPGLNPRSWHVIRGGIDGIVTVEVTDPDDPTPSWVISSRTPDRLAYAIAQAQATRRTPYR